MQRLLKVPMWHAEPEASLSAAKRSLCQHRRAVILPAVRAAMGATPLNPPLPWLWIATEAGTRFPLEAFVLWWQLRALGQSYPASTYPRCDNRPYLSSDHPRCGCSTFATLCWASCIRPEDAFGFPRSREWFTAVILSTNEVIRAMRRD